MNNEQMRFVKKTLLFICHICLYILYKQGGEFGRYKEFSNLLRNIEEQFGDQWE